MEHYRISTTDGEIGTVTSFLFDDLTWTVRYIVVDTGSWLNEKKVLITPRVVDRADGLLRLLEVNLTKEQVENSPDIDTRKPISQQKELEFHRHFKWPVYWKTARGLPDPDPRLLADREGERRPFFGIDEKDESMNIRSTEEIIGYSIKALDGDIGQVDDFIIDDERVWVIRYIAVNTKAWLPGKTVLINPLWVNNIVWEDENVHVGARKKAIENCPEFKPEKSVNWEYEPIMFNYYGRPTYRVEE
jgi:hypothetical protein